MEPWKGRAAGRPSLVLMAASRISSEGMQSFKVRINLSHAGRTPGTDSPIRGLVSVKICQSGTISRRASSQLMSVGQCSPSLQCCPNGLVVTGNTLNKVTRSGCQFTDPPGRCYSGTDNTARTRGIRMPICREVRKVFCDASRDLISSTRTPGGPLPCA